MKRLKLKSALIKDRLVFFLPEPANGNIQHLIFEGMTLFAVIKINHSEKPYTPTV